ncbi:zinc ribbon domain-containing protein [Lacticaseibacillus casei]|jgi:hypothetical protein|uniref:Zinc ribbon domain-containing protein n=1 Tax=Lacticaseibacillus huelsenbergensis TaxID=3035291 RepID=A0ABY8DTC3_9LACO|nr:MULTISPECIES: zinc ribbon domain-containing protein [Lacticaseibacillus]MDG3062290.1 zinc ribbon domain-containing protein [Lacticaseibacillus sp. BCRC 81376]QVI36467.1 zinc ribbon domain-containing protein [Lacticaseibacillus casei]QXG58265.1 zinc ribbon domain-containing protein [Lacticaseibacillus casei]WFB40261.1 zinc ribbon domain-containing protein [Lacticaseibacillus huelsenbergensis]WFB42011.1 zinc ribbon domain-containing protein [Lacticaseibacillus huelsenbergensis]
MKTEGDVAIMFCPNCGAKVPEEADFCPNCGQPLNAKLKAQTAGYQKAEESAAPAETEKIVKPAKLQKSHRSVIIGVLIALVVVVCGYVFVYAPNMAKQAVLSNGFTGERGYSVQINALKRTVTIQVGSDQLSNISGAFMSGGFSTYPINQEKQMAKAANDLSGKVIGQWHIKEVTMKKDQKTPIDLWEFTGTKETMRYQDTDDFRAAKDAYDAKEKQAADEDQAQSNADSAIGGAIFGGILGWVLSR